MEGKNCQRLFAMIFCLFSALLFSGRQPTEYVNEAGSCSSCGVVRATWKFSPHCFSTGPAVYKRIVSLDRARGPKVMQNRSSYRVCKNKM